MALIRCPDCGKEFSDTAVACPNCGRPHTQVQPVEIRKRPGCLAMGCLTLLVLAVIGTIVGEHSKPTTPGGPSSEVSKYTGATPATPAAPADGWDVSRSTSTMDDSKTVSVSLDATNHIVGWLAAKLPNLTIRCQEHRTQLYIDVGMAANPELGEYNTATVRLRLDGQPAFTQHWSESTDHEALFAPDAIALSKRLARAKRLRFVFTPFNANPATAEFDLTGLGKHLPELAQTCGWAM